MPKRPQAADLATFAQERPARSEPVDRSSRVAFNTYLPSATAERLRVLAWTLSAHERRRVTVTELVERAVLELLEANGG